MQPKGKTMLKVVGILLLIFAAVRLAMGLIATVLGAILGSALVGAADDAETAGAIAGIGLLAVFLIMLLLLVDGTLGLIAGILGVKNCGKPEKVKPCFALGIVLIVLYSIGFLEAIAAQENFFAELIGLALSILYTVGAHQVKSSLAAPPQGFAAPPQTYYPQPPIPQQPYYPPQPQVPQSYYPPQPQVPQTYYPPQTYPPQQPVQPVPPQNGVLAETFGPDSGPSPR